MHRARRQQLDGRAKAISKWESGAITAPAIVEEKARLRLGRARARIALNDMVDGTLPEKARGAVEDYGVAIGIMEDDLRRNPGKLMYSGLGRSFGKL